MHRSLTQEIKTFDSYAELDGQVSKPSIQRSLMDNHVEDMVRHIIDRHAQHMQPIFGAIDLVRLDNTYYVIDGQHRLAALQRAFNSHQIKARFFCVIYHVKNKDEMANVFKTRNRGIPVPDFIINIQGSKREILDEIHRYITGLSLFNYNIKRPNINITDFMAQISRPNILDMITCFQDFKVIYDKVNNDTKVKYASPGARRKAKITDNMYRICNESGIWIGLDKNMPWCEEGYNMIPFTEELEKAKTLGIIPIVPNQSNRTNLTQPPINQNTVLPYNQSNGIINSGSRIIRMPTSRNVGQQPTIGGLNQPTIMTISRRPIVTIPSTSPNVPQQPPPAYSSAITSPSLNVPQESPPMYNSAITSRNIPTVHIPSNQNGQVVNGLQPPIINLSEHHPTHSTFSSSGLVAPVFHLEEEEDDYDMVQSSSSSIYPKIN